MCWWGEMTFLGHLFALFQVPWFEATVAFGQHPIREADRKVLAGRLWQAVATSFTPVVKVEEACITDTR